MVRSRCFLGGGRGTRTLSQILCAFQRPGRQPEAPHPLPFFSTCALQPPGVKTGEGRGRPQPPVPLPKASTGHRAWGRGCSSTGCTHHLVAGTLVGTCCLGEGGDLHWPPEACPRQDWVRGVACGPGHSMETPARGTGLAICVVLWKLPACLPS